MSELEKMMGSLPKLVYEKANGELFVVGFQSQPMNENINSLNWAAKYFDKMIELYCGENNEDEYNRELVYLYKKIRNLVMDFPITITESRKFLEQLCSEDIVHVSKQVEMYKYVRSIYSNYK